MTQLEPIQCGLDILAPIRAKVKHYLKKKYLDTNNIIEIRGTAAEVPCHPEECNDEGSSQLITA